MLKFVGHWLPYADHIIVLDEGRIKQHGSYLELRSRPGFVSNLVMEHIDLTSLEASQVQVDISDLTEVPEEDETESFNKLNGEWPVYKFYTRTVGNWTMFISTVMIALYTAGQIYQSKFGQRVPVSDDEDCN